MASYNSAGFLGDAVATALNQQGVSVEVLIIDDCSTDNSLACAHALAAQDDRIKVFQTPQNSGPGAARNIGIGNMRGRWYAMLDCDDAMEPERCQTLIQAAERAGADMIADDLTVFGEGLTSYRHLGNDYGDAARDINLDDYFSGTIMYSDKPNLGFLKPMVRSAIINGSDIQYREDLRIGEDDEFVIRLLLAGARYTYHPQALYDYRKHDASISHRLSADHSALMVKSENDIRARVATAGFDSPAYKARFAAILDAAAFARSIEAIKARNFADAVTAMIERPSALRHFAMPIKARLQRTMGN